ncbi:MULTISPECIES: hypothetical protein [unclassified Moorena]|nr:MULTISPECIES: hypothetical protein [unclassified Moorena]NEQ11199.1 hypothetical protein [Moorena sp. SIO4E2]NES42726.1 hypothetical protein [Moorena sp. SIO2C4]NET65245.1 hypothetical protein [Moorena sp. SIO1G6]
MEWASCLPENETGKMPIPPRCPFHQDARSSKIPVLPRCPFYKTIQIIP